MDLRARIRNIRSISRRTLLTPEAFMFEPKVKIERNLYETLKRAAQVAGYSSVDEFIIHILEKTAAEVEQAQSEEEVRKRLQGLGYIE